MKKTTLIASLLLLTSVNAFADFAVIVHPDNKATISEAQIRDIYLLNSRNFPNGDPVEIFNFTGDTAVKNAFYTGILKKSEARLNSYWVRALFSSKANPPKDKDTAQAIKEAVANNPSAIGFINAKDVDSSVRVVLTR